LTYQFHEKYLSRGSVGGQAAADQFMEKVREYLSSLGSAIDDPKTVPVMVKAYANLSGLAQACVRDRKLSSVSDMAQFWLGFTRRYPLVDFVDVGSGREEADNKLRSNCARILQVTESSADLSRGARFSHRQSPV
jgi:hypothetical protein